MEKSFYIIAPPITDKQYFRPDSEAPDEQSKQKMQPGLITGTGSTKKDKRHVVVELGFGTPTNTGYYQQPYSSGGYGGYNNNLNNGGYGGWSSGGRGFGGGGGYNYNNGYNNNGYNNGYNSGYNNDHGHHGHHGYDHGHNDHHHRHRHRHHSHSSHHSHYWFCKKVFKIIPNMVTVS